MRAALVLIITVLFIYFQQPFVVMAAAHVDPVVARNGVLDLRDYNFAASGPIDLNGTWSFYWDRLLTPAQIQAGQEVSNPMVVPQDWDGQHLFGQKLSGHGFATYHLKVLLPESAIERLMALYITGVSSSYRLWVNGRLLGQNGVVGTSRQTMAPKTASQLVMFQPGREEVDLCLQVANFSLDVGGIWYPITLGYQPQIQHQREVNLAGVFFAVGSLLLLGIYRFIIYMMNRSDKASLFLSVTSIITAFRTMVIGDQFLNIFFPSFPWEILIKTQYLTATLGTLYFTRYIYEMFPKETNRFFAYAVRTIMTVYSIFVIVTPAAVYTNWLISLQIVIVLTFMVLVVISVLAYAHKRFGSGLNLVGVSLYSATVFSDNLYYAHIISIGPLVMWGFLGFLFMQSILLAKRFTAAYREADHLSRALAAVNESLEVKITERTEQLSKALAELSAMEQDHRQLIDDIAHEIGTPLSKIQGYVKAILDGIIKDNYPKYLQIVYEKTEFIGHMLQDLYQLANLQTHQLTFDMRLVDIVSWMKALYRKYSPEMANHKLEFTVRGQITVPNHYSAYVRVDPIRLEQVISNLLFNAVKYSPDGSVITLGLQLSHLATGQNSMVDIFVTSQGAGIPEEEQEKIFHRFYRRKDVQGETPGAGLGLAICREIVHNLGGDVSVESGQHCNTFTLTLPMSILFDETEGDRQDG